MSYLDGMASPIEPEETEDELADPQIEASLLEAAQNAIINENIHSRSSALLHKLTEAMNGNVDADMLDDMLGETTGLGLGLVTEHDATCFTDISTGEEVDPPLYSLDSLMPDINTAVNDVDSLFYPADTTDDDVVDINPSFYPPNGPVLGLWGTHISSKTEIIPPPRLQSSFSVRPDRWSRTHLIHIRARITHAARPLTTPTQIPWAEARVLISPGAPTKSDGLLLSSVSVHTRRAVFRRALQSTARPLAAITAATDLVNSGQPYNARAVASFLAIHTTAYVTRLLELYFRRHGARYCPVRKGGLPLRFKFYHSSFRPAWTDGRRVWVLEPKNPRGTYAEETAALLAIAREEARVAAAGREGLQLGPEKWDKQFLFSVRMADVVLLRVDVRVETMLRLEFGLRNPEDNVQVEIVGRWNIMDEEARIQLANVVAAFASEGRIDGL